MSTITNNTEALQKLRDLLSNIPICMMATTNADGFVMSRPMTTISIEDDGSVLFYTNEFGELAEEQQHDDVVYLIYSDAKEHTYVHLRGQSHIIRDRDQIKEHWKPMLKAWFPEGVDDPKLCLLRVTVEEAQYWDSTSNKMVVFFDIVKAILKKEQYNEGDRGSLYFSDNKDESIH